MRVDPQAGIEVIKLLVQVVTADDVVSSEERVWLDACHRDELARARINGGMWL